MKVIDLVPGMRVRLAKESAVFVAQCPHPLYEYPMRMVIWRMDEDEKLPDGRFKQEPTGRWSHDALHYNQEVGIPDESDHISRRRNLKHALFDRSQWND